MTKRNSTGSEGKLTDAEKTFVVTRLACYDPPTVVLKALEAEFGKKPSLQAIEYYNYGCYQSRKLAKKWVDLFNATRKAFTDDVAAHGIANKAFRLQRMHTMMENAFQKGNYPLAASILEQAAKEMGDMFTNKRQVDIPGGVTLQITRDDANL